jgi:hypothetical protein
MIKVTSLGGHSNGVGLHLYYDSFNRLSRFSMEILPDLLNDSFLQSIANGSFLNNSSPAPTDAEYKNSPSINPTTYKEIGTWSFTLQ